jgi:hypothetical protein
VRSGRKTKGLLRDSQVAEDGTVAGAWTGNSILEETPLEAHFRPLRRGTSACRVQ